MSKISTPQDPVADGNLSSKRYTELASIGVPRDPVTVEELERAWSKGFDRNQCLDRFVVDAAVGAPGCRQHGADEVTLLMPADQMVDLLTDFQKACQSNPGKVMNFHQQHCTLAPTGFAPSSFMDTIQYLNKEWPDAHRVERVLMAASAFTITANRELHMPEASFLGELIYAHVCDELYAKGSRMYHHATKEPLLDCRRIELKPAYGGPLRWQDVVRGMAEAATEFTNDYRLVRLKVGDAPSPSVEAMVKEEPLRLARREAIGRADAARRAVIEEESNRRRILECKAMNPNFEDLKTATKERLMELRETRTIHQMQDIFMVDSLAEIDRHYASQGLPAPRRKALKKP